MIQKILDIASAAPFDVIDSRSDKFLESGVTKKLREARVQCEGLSAQKTDLAALFKLKLLPDREGIASALRGLSVKRNVFRFLSREWWKFRALYYSIATSQNRVSTDIQVEQLSKLLDFEDARISFESDNEIRRLLGPLFAGLSTDFDELEILVRWYAKAESDLSPYQSPGSGLDLVQLVTNLPKQTLTWLASRNKEFGDARAWLAELDSILNGVFSTKDQISNFAVLPDERLDEFTERLRLYGSELTDIANTLQRLFKTNESATSGLELIKKHRALAVATQDLIQMNATCGWMGRWFRGLDTDLVALDSTQKWAQSVVDIKLPTELQSWILTPKAGRRAEELVSAAATVAELWDEISEIFSGLNKFGSLDLSRWYGERAVTAKLTRERALEALSAVDLLVTWADLSRAIDRTAQQGLRPVCDPVLQGLISPNQLIPCFRLAIYNSIAKSIFRQHKDLMQFSGLSHQQLKEKFRDLDLEVIQLNRKKSAVDISRRLVPLGVGYGYVRDYTERHLLENEIRKKKRHIPIRQLVNRAGGALQALKPCFMMSPLSVAQYLEPGMRSFDLVVIDEASQVKPEDSIGAIARGNQVVVVGDPKQLPPTSFFDTVMDDSEEDEEKNALEESESILDVSQTKFQPARRLRWHYRSKHHSLIHFSNTYFYNDQPLFIFPSPFEAQDGLGIHWNFVSNGVYENRQNAEESVNVVDAVIEHIKKRPNDSLGVVTLNRPQRDLIQDEFDKRLKSDIKVDRYLAAWHSKGEPFFIKNLENVQGDERDVILISATYGRNRQGAFYQRFGPITAQTGWRRLNVLFTRAKKCIELFSSMQPEDIKIDGTMSKGVQALRNYLIYAKTGNLESIETSAREADSDFEIAVGNVLEHHGYQILPQLGVAGFFIDIAVRHPDRAGEFIAAIECDGATYHSSKSARDRDRLRQEILEKLGWQGRIYRIWSADWFKDPKTQTRRLLGFLAETLEKNRRDSPTPQIAEEPIVEDIQTSLFETSQDRTEETLEKEQLSQEWVAQLWDYVTFTYLDDPSSYKSVQIVKGQTDIETGVIGENMPLARALLGCAVGEKVQLNLPGRPQRELEVISIER